MKKDLVIIKELKVKYFNFKFGDIEKIIEIILFGDNLEKMVLLLRDYNKNLDFVVFVFDFKKLVFDIFL